MIDRTPPTLGDIETLANVALGSIPPRLKNHLGAVVIQVEEFPDEETEEAMELDSPFDILGLYRGVALPHKSISDPRPSVDMIFLYPSPDTRLLVRERRRPWRTRPPCADPRDRPSFWF
jgi:predicted Zn-dependent protease with MMP-like domain